MGLRPKWHGYCSWGVREAGGVGYWSTDRTAVEVKNVYIDFGLPYLGIPVPITFRVGAQTLGIRPHILMVTDGMGVQVAAKVDPVQVSCFYAKAVEGLTWASDDSDVYALQANVKLGTVTIGGYGLYFNMNSYPFWVTSAYARDSSWRRNPYSMGRREPICSGLGAILTGS